MSVFGLIKNGPWVDEQMHNLVRTTECEDQMAESVFKVIELMGTGSESWEKAVAVAVSRASKTLRDLSVRQ